jgi:hypothetical protein
MKACMKSCPFLVVSSPNEAGFVPASIQQPTDLGAQLVLELGECWSRKFASPKEVGFWRESGRSNTSALRRAPALGWKIRERENILIKNNIARNINVPFRWVKTFETFVGVAVAKKDTSFGTELNLFCIVGAKIGPTCTPKSSKV